jgi:GST-like protein
MQADQMITVFGVQSPNVLKVLLMLEELGLPYATRPVSLFKGEQFTPEFLALNPVGKVPVLLDPALGKPLGESGAILIWLAEHHHAFLPTDAADRYEVFQWLMVQMSAIGPMLGQFTHFKLLPEDSEPYAHGRYKALAERLYGLIDKRVADREWIAGSDYSIADIATVPWALYLERHGFDVADYPSMKGWRDRITARPAAIRAQGRLVDGFSNVAAETMKTVSPQDLDRFFERTEAMPQTDYSIVRTLK